MRIHRLIVAAILAAAVVAPLQAKETVNLATEARISASSEYSGNHLAVWAIDGKVPELECKADEKEGYNC